MGEPLVLTFDIGTQSARCLLVRKDGSFADYAQEKYTEPYYSRNPGWAEQRPDFYYDRICMLAKEICERNVERLSDIIAVTMTVIRDTVLCLDKNKEPLRDMILWLDRREADFDHPFPLWKSVLFKIAGMESATKTLYCETVANWLKQNQPEIWAKTDKYVMLPTYLNYKLTGALTDAEANMIGHIPFDSKKRVWKKKNDFTRCITDVPEEKLMTVGQLCKNKLFLLMLVVMLCAGASELTMSQWSSLFAETGLGVSKTLGDLLGPCLFAALMGTGRLLYGLYGSRLNLRNSLIFCGCLCILCYLTTVFAPHPLLSLVGCAVCGFSVSLMWPGAFSDTAARFPMGGTAMFGMMAVFGDLGASLGPWMSGVVSDLSQKTNLLQQIQSSTGEELSQLGLKTGLLAAVIFPLVLVLSMLYLKKRRKADIKE